MEGDDVTGSTRVKQGSHSDWKNGKAFSSQEKSGNFKETGKVRKIHIKYWKNENISDKYYLIFLAIFKLTVYDLLK